LAIGGALEGVVALDDRRAVAAGVGDVVADADHLGVLGQVRTLGLELVERVLADAGQVAAVAEQQRRADRRAGQHRGRDGSLPVALVHERDRGRAVEAAGRGEQRAGHARGVGGHVGASDSDRVAGRAGREAQLGGGLGVVLTDAELGRLALVVADRAAAQHSGEKQRDGQATHGGAD
jgi:hypothetical protein